MMRFKKVIVFLLLFFSFYAVSSQNYADSFEICIVSYNEIDSKGIEQQVLTFGWFKEVPIIPIYTYFDKDIGKKVTIKSKTNSYKGENAFESELFVVIPGKYGEIYGKCKSSENLFLICDLNKTLEEYIGESYAFEIKEGSNETHLIIQSYPFGMDFPFKFEDDVVISTFKIADLEKKCGEKK